MTGILTFLAAVFVFGIVVLVHEWGHFMAARASGIRVLEFAIGMGPTLYSKTVGGTKYSIRLLPIGGYNRMMSREEEDAIRADGEEPDYEPSLVVNGVSQGGYYEDAAPWKRILTLVAGPVMNFILGFVLLCVVLSSAGLIATRQVATVEENSSAAQSGLQPEDRILKVNGHSCLVASDIFYELERTVNDQADFLVLRDGERLLLQGVHFDRITTEDGYSYLDIGFKVYGVKPGVLTTPRAALNYTLYYAKIIFTSLSDLATGRESVNNLSGPVGIVEAINEAVKVGFDQVLNLAILISVNLGVFNLMPIPGLDGGQIFFTLIEWVIRKPIPERLRGAANFAGFAVLIAIMLFATSRDVIRMFFS